MTTENYRGYKFGYVKDRQDHGKIKVYVENQPSYKERNTKSNTIHRYPGSNGSPPYICFKRNSKPSSLSEAKKLAHKWADKTEIYIRTGVSISDQIKQG